MIKTYLYKIGGNILKIINKNKQKPLFDLNNIFDLQKEMDINEPKKIKIRFLHFSGGLWYAIGGIVKNFVNDDKYDIKIVIENRYDYLGAIKECINAGVDYCLVNDYDAEKDKPDIFVFYYGNNISDIGKLRENCKLVVCAAFQVIRYMNSVEEFWEKNLCYAEYHPDIFLFDKMMYNDLYINGYNKDKLILTGAQIYDDIYCVSKKRKEEFTNFSKLNNKRTLLWATDHGVYYSRVSNDITFDLYARTIFDYFKKHQEVGLIFRPHPTFIREMINHGYWTKDEIERTKELLNSSNNIIFDISASITDALVYSDAIITDAFCSVSAYAYPLHKPIGLLYRNEKLNPYHKELDDSLMSIRSKEALIEFLNKFINDYDSLCNKMLFNDDKILCYFDGNNSVRAKEIIEKKYNLLNK